MIKRDPKTVIQEALAYRERWGEHGFGNIINPDELLNASKALLDMGVDGEGPTVQEAMATAKEHDELVLIKRQLTAAKAREAKQKKQIESLQSELREAQSVIRDMQLSSEG